jgi:hypothetical protein
MKRMLLATMFAACSLHGQTITELQAQIAVLQKQVTALQTSSVQALAPFLKVDLSPKNGVQGPNIVISGANVQIVNGTGQTGIVNGRGNLIIGYDELPSPALSAGDRGGSHNLVMGMANKFTTWAYSGIVNGVSNVINGESDVILSGDNNVIAGNVSGLNRASVIITGQGNTMFDATDSAIVSGVGNNIGNEYSVIVGGYANRQGGIESVILGGANVSYAPLDGFGFHEVSAAGLPGAQ